MKRVFALLLTLTLLFSLAACGGKTPSDGQTGSKPSGDTLPATSAPPAASTTPAVSTPHPEPTPAPIPDAEVDPDELEWGYQSSDSMDTQYWYVDGERNPISFIFFDDDCLTIVEGSARETVDTLIVDQHIVDAETEGEQFDFVFTDLLTCYDLVGECWYQRADPEILVESLTAATFVCDAGDEWKITFHDDGTLLYENDGETENGIWWIGDARTIHTHLESEAEGYGGWMDIFYREDTWEIDHLEDTDSWYPEQ